MFVFKTIYVGVPLKWCENKPEFVACHLASNNGNFRRYDSQWLILRSHYQVSKSKFRAGVFFKHCKIFRPNVNCSLNHLRSPGVFIQQISFLLVSFRHSWKYVVYVFLTFEASEKYGIFTNWNFFKRTVDGRILIINYIYVDDHWLILNYAAIRQYFSKGSWK